MINGYEPESATDIHPKVAAATVVGTPLAVVLVWIATELDLDMSPEVATAFGALLAGLVGYLKSSVPWFKAR